MLLRNVTNDLIEYSAFFATTTSGSLGPIGLLATSEDGRSIPHISFGAGRASTKSRTVGPKMQQKYEQRVDTVLDLKTNGTYIIQAAIDISPPPGVVVTSAKVKIRIEGKEAPK
jgi:hypothetical protein